MACNFFNVNNLLISNNVTFSVYEMIRKQGTRFYKLKSTKIIRSKNIKEALLKSTGYCFSISKRRVTSFDVTLSKRDGGAAVGGDSRGGLFSLAATLDCDFQIWNRCSIHKSKVAFSSRPVSEIHCDVEVVSVLTFEYYNTSLRCR